MNKKIITRFAPSPTGAAHAGSYRTAMFAWLFARHHNGKFVLRIEDTDTARNQTEAVQGILDSLAWLGLDHDEYYVQSDQVNRHAEIIKNLIDTGYAYVSHEEAKDGSGVIKDIIRFKNPNTVVTVRDLIRGDVSVDTTDLGDFVIARSLTEPIFHLANVIDDHDEGITHVIRAEEHLANTPRQILIFQALDWDIPTYAHVPIVLGTDKQKLSKRRGALPMMEYARLGYLPDAVFNAVVMVGWNPGNGEEREIFSREELVTMFDLAQVQSSSAVFNEEKLRWFNREYIKKLSDDEKKAWVIQFLPEKLKILSDEMLTKLVPIITERIDYFGQITEFANAGEYDYYISTPEFPIEKIIWKTDDLNESKKHIKEIVNILQNYTGNWSAEGIKSVIWDYAESVGRGSALWPMRYILSGRDKSPDPFALASILGRTETLDRLSKVVINTD